MKTEKQIRKIKNKLVKRRKDINNKNLKTNDDSVEFLRLRIQIILLSEILDE